MEQIHGKLTKENYQFWKEKYCKRFMVLYKTHQVVDGELEKMWN